MLEQLESLWQRGFLSDLDLHFARLMGRLEGSNSSELLLAAALVCRATGRGSVCISIPALAGRPVGDPDDTSELLSAPDADTWLQALRASAMVGGPGDFRPLILDRRGRLYLYRYWEYEARLARELLTRAAAEPEVVDGDDFRRRLAELFPAAATEGDTDWQKIAAANAVLKRVCVISGGPGTGKTTTVVRILALLVGLAGNRPLRIGLAAPTGKAAARLQEAVRHAKRQLNLERPAVIPDETSTIHRLLGARPDSLHFRFHSDNPLPLDVLVVDEASMVDLALMARLVAALPARARLILLGDKDQLASVEAGAVLGDICGQVHGFSESWGRRLEAITGQPIPSGKTVCSGLADCVVPLRHSYRFNEESGIARLAAAIKQGQGGQALAMLEEGGFSDLSWRPSASLPDMERRLLDSIEQGYRPYLDAVTAAASPAEVFARFNRFRVLCALREGPVGVQGVNRLSEKVLQAKGLLATGQTWYPGRPVIIIRNHYPLRLYNGDVGITLPDPKDGDRLRIFFQTADGGLRRFAPARLPEHETVFAMTVHKSQGSEFDHVLMVLPMENSQVLTRELIYTGISRARRSVAIWASGPVLKSAVEHLTRRSSGLGDVLWGV